MVEKFWFSRGNTSRLHCPAASSCQVVPTPPSSGSELHGVRSAAVVFPHKSKVSGCFAPCWSGWKLGTRLPWLYVRGPQVKGGIRPCALENVLCILPV
nr:MAG TPA: hypothetical protein [Caudoviricetes sp.]